MKDNEHKLNFHVVVHAEGGMTPPADAKVPVESNRKPNREEGEGDEVRQDELREKLGNYLEVEAEKFRSRTSFRGTAQIFDFEVRGMSENLEMEINYIVSIAFDPKNRNYDVQKMSPDGMAATLFTIEGSGEIRHYDEQADATEDAHSIRVEARCGYYFSDYAEGVLPPTAAETLALDRATAILHDTFRLGILVSMERDQGMGPLRGGN